MTTDDLRILAAVTLTAVAVMVTGASIHAAIAGSWWPLLGALIGAGVGIPTAAALIAAGHLATRRNRRRNK